MTFSGDMIIDDAPAWCTWRVDTYHPGSNCGRGGTRYVGRVQPCVKISEFSADCAPAAVPRCVFTSDGKEIIRYQPEEKREARLPEPATEPPPPAEISTIEELYLTGLHLEQYRH